MCKAFSAIVTRRKIYWKMGMDSHEEIKKHFKLDDTGNKLVPIEIIPEDYLNMKKDKKSWDFKFDEQCPDWWKASHENMSWSACLKWREEIAKKVNFKEARNPIHPFKIKTKKVTKVQIKLLKKWDSVRDSVESSVRAFIGSLFYLQRKEWKYTDNIKCKGYPFQSCVELWKQGLVPSFDGTYWRLHTRKKAKVVFKISKSELKKIQGE